MKKLITLILLAISTTINVKAQCTLAENFTSYTGASSALPAGWIGKGLVATGNSYTTAASSGPSGANSFKFQTNGATLFTPTFTAVAGDSAYFWIKANGVTDTVTLIQVYIGADTTTMTLAKTFNKNSIVTAGAKVGIALLGTTKVIKFKYTKVAGNFSFDDFCFKKQTTACAAIANFTYSLGAAGVVNFTSTSTGAASFYWTFGDGLDTLLQNPSHTYLINGSYVVTLYAHDSSATCLDTIVKTINVTNITTPCTLNASFTKFNGAGGLVTFTNNTTGNVGTTTYNWNFGDGAAASIANPTHTYTSNGTYTVKLIVTDVNCADTSTVLITVSNAPANTALTCFLTENFTTYTGAASALPSGWMGAGLAATGNVYTTGASSGPSGVNAFKFQTNGATLYTPSFNVTSGDSATFWVKANGIGDTIGGLQVFIGADTTTMTLAKFVNKNSIPVVGGKVGIQLNATTHFIKFKYIKTSGNMSFDDMCIKTDSVTSQPCNLVPSFTTVNGANGLVTFTNTSTSQTGTSAYNWKLGDSSTATAANPTHTYAANGTYNVTMYVSDGAATCSDSIVKQIVITNVLNPLNCSLSANFSASNGTNGLVTFLNTTLGSANTTNNWSFGDGTTSTLSNPSHTYASNGTYSVSLIATDSLCIDTIIKTVIINNIPTGGTSTCIVGEDFTTYTGASSALPSGWIGKGLAATGNVYTTVTSSGPSGANAFKFQTNNATLISPMFNVTTGDSATFWVKANSIIDTLTFLKVYTGADTTTMALVKTITKNNIATTGQKIALALLPTTHYIKFKYTKIAGNMSFDDFCIKSDSIIVTPPCNLATTFTATNDTNGLVHFTSVYTANVGAVTFAWNFGDGTTSTVQNPNHQYTTNGTYTATLIVNDSLCTSSYNTTVNVTNVTPAPCNIVANFTYTKTANGNVLFSTTATGTSTLTTYSYDFGDGASSSLPLPSHQYASNGTYVVTLVVTDTATGCTNTFVDSVNVTSIPTCVLSENFTGFTGSSSALPTNWVGYNLPASGNAYTTAASCGPSGINAFKFATLTKPTLITPMFTVANGDSVSFWVKGNSLDSLSKLEVFIGDDTTTMVLKKTIKKSSIATAGTFVTVGLAASNHYAKFVYTKVAGNMSFDDFCVKNYSPIITVVNDTKAITALNIYPNPNNGVFTIALNGANNTTANIVIVNVLGQVVYNTNTTLTNGNINQTINLNNVSNGNYVLKATLGNKVITQKINVNN
jgi:PKD repeat protein